MFLNSNNQSAGHSRNRFNTSLDQCGFTIIVKEHLNTLKQENKSLLLILDLYYKGF